MSRTLVIVGLALTLAACGGDEPTPLPTAPPAPPPSPPPPPPAPEAPATPTGLMVSATTVDSITWTWDAVEGATAYVVQVSTNETFDDEDDVTAFALMPTHTVSGLEPESSVHLRVASAIGTSLEDAVTSDWTDAVAGMSAMPPPPPAPATPTGLEVSAATIDSITWTWDEVEGVTAYVVQVSANETFGDEDDVTALALMPTHTVSELEPESSVHLRVASAIGTSIEDAVTSDWTDAVAGMTLASPSPPAPSIAGDWLVVAGPTPPLSLTPGEGASADACFVTEWRNVFQASQEVQEPDRIFRIEQSGAELTGHVWANDSEETGLPWPPDLETAQPGWRIAGTIGLDGISVRATHRWRENEWAAYPYLAVEAPAALMVANCPEYAEETLRITAARVELTLSLGAGGVIGQVESDVHFSIGAATWIQTQGPTDIRVSPFRP